MVIPLDRKEIVTVQKLAISNMLEIEALRELLFEKGIITEEEFLGKFKELDREMKERMEKTRKGDGEKWGVKQWRKIRILNLYFLLDKTP